MRENNDTLQSIADLVERAARAAENRQDRHWQAVIKTALEAQTESELRRILSTVVDMDEE